MDRYTAPIRTGTFDSEVISLAELKAHLEVTIPDDDAMIELHRATAVELIEALSGRVAINTAHEFYFDQFPGCDDDGHPGALVLGRSPLATPPELEVAYINETDGVYIVLDSDTYKAKKDRKRVALVPTHGNSWPIALCTADAVRVKATVGFGADESAVPPWIKHCVKMLCRTWYDIRLEVVPNMNLAQLPTPVAFDSVIAPHCVPGW